MMKNGNDENENADGLDARDDAALWDLLGRAPVPEAGPYFTRRVLREVGLHEEAHPAARAGVRWWRPAALWRACRRLPRVAFVAGAPVAALLLLFLGLRLNPANHPYGPGREAMTTPSIQPADQPLEDSDEGPAALRGTSVAAAALPDDFSVQDVEVIADLDNLLKREESRLWTEEDTARF